MKTLNPNAHAPDSQQGDQTTLNPNGHAPDAQQSDQTPVTVSAHSSRDGGVIFDLGSCSETELMVLKEKFIKDVERIRSLIKQIEARELELDEAEDVDSRKQEDSVDKSSKITGHKRTMPVTPDRENKRKRTKIMELDSTESRKVEATMMRKCGLILDKLTKHRHGWVFNKPVDVVDLKLTDYYEVVKHPMDLGTVKLNLGKRVYETPLDFARDVRLTFDNALLYNRKGETVHIMATVLLDMFHKLFDSAYEKYEVERQNVIVEQTKVSKQKVLCDAAPLVKTLDTKNCVETAKKPVKKKQMTVTEVKENPRMRKEMSGLERDELGMVLQELAGEHLDEILQIVGKRNSKMMTPDEEGEIEVDVHALDSETLWDLHRFARLNSKAEQNDKFI